MLRISTSVFIVASVATTVTAECANGCSGHGACSAFDMCVCYRNWMGNDCHDRICAFGIAHVDTPKGDLDASTTISDTTASVVFNSDMYPFGTTEQYPRMEDTDLNPLSNTAHAYMECSNKGSCDRNTGICDCYEGYDGNACQRASCPGYPIECSGHGVCRNAEQIAKMNYGNVYKLWDRHSTMGCHCDAGYYGPDCSKRDCKWGLDPLYEDDVAQAKVGVYDFGVLTTGTQFSDGMSNSGNSGGKWAIRFFDNQGDDWLTDAIPAWATCDEVVSALESLPGNTVPKNSLECRRVMHDSSTNALSWTNSYTNAGGDGTHIYNFYYKMASWALISNPNVVSLPNSWVESSADAANQALTASFAGTIYRIKFNGNPGALREPQIELYLDGKRPSLIGVGDETIVTFVVTDGQQGEDTDHFADHCDDVTVTMNAATNSGAFSTDYISLGGLDATELALLKKCLGDADGDTTNNVEVYNWDHGSATNPHLIKLVRTVSSFNDGAYYAAIYWNATSGLFHLLNPFMPADGGTDDYYEVYTTKGTLARASPTAVAYFGYGGHSLVTTVTDFQTVTDDESGYDGDVACETYPDDSTNVPNCLSYNDYFTLLDYANPMANSPYINLYRAKRIWNGEFASNVGDSVTGISGSTHPLHRGVHIIETDLALNWGGDDTTSNGHQFQVYRFMPHVNSSYTYVAPCSNRGVCDEDSGLCNCFDGYSNDDCSVQEAMAI